MLRFSYIVISTQASASTPEANGLKSSLPVKGELQAKGSVHPDTAIIIERKPMSSPKAKHILDRQIALRKTLWPEIENRHLWYRKERDGFATMPRPMPLIMNSMDHLSGKGFPVGQVYLDLWCRTMDEGFLQLNRPEEMAFHSGFSGQRAVRTWKDRMKRLAELGFIGIIPGPLGDMSFAILFNPFHVLKRAHIGGSLPENYWRSLIIRANEINATDFDDLDDTGKLLPPPPPPPPAPNPFAAMLAANSAAPQPPPSVQAQDGQSAVTSTVPQLPEVSLD